MRSVALVVALVALVAAGGTAAHSIKHVVVLMQENRSFDHLLGYLNRINPEIDGANPLMCNPYNTSDISQGQVCHEATAQYVDPDPGHSLNAATEQIFGANTEEAQRQNPAPMNGFVQQNNKVEEGLGDRVMRGFSPEFIPTAASLVENFAVFDRWFSGMPGPTQPNRFYLHAATSSGMTSNDVPTLVRGLDEVTIFENFDRNGLTWKSYFQEVPATVFFRYLRRQPAIGNINHYSKFKEDASNGTLPNYSFIDPRYFDTPRYAQNDDHPSADVSEGQKLFKDVYETLRASPQWEDTVLIITYDEHGGYYDHVPTPLTDVPNPDGIVGKDPAFNFERLGVRVPTIVISPWVSKGLVVHRPDGPTPSSEYDHSSVHSTLKDIFGLENYLTKRDEWSGSFSHIFNLTEPRTDCPMTVPAPAAPLRHFMPDLDRELSELQQEFVTLASALTESDPTKVETGKDMTVREATKFIRKQVNTFFGRQMYPPEEMAYYESL